jgi:nitroreductase
MYMQQIDEARATAYRDLEEALARGERSERLDQHARMMRTVQYLGEHFADVPVIIAALLQTPDDAMINGGSIFPAVWSIQLAARALGVGTVPVGSLAFRQDEVFELLGVPPGEDWRLAATVTLSYPTGRWGVPERRPVHDVTYAERWGQRPDWTVPQPLWPSTDT